MATTKAKSKKPKKKTAILNVDGVDLPVTFNTTGRLDKKSQDAFNAILNKKLAQNTVSRFTARDAVEIAGFGGLVGMIYLGSDIALNLLLLLNPVEAVAEAAETLKKGIIKTNDDILAALGEFSNLITAPFQELLIGMSKKDVDNAKESAKAKIGADQIAAKKAADRIKEQFRRQLGETPTSEFEAKVREAIEKVDEQQKKLEAEKAAREAKEFERLLFKIKIAGAFGGAYVIKKFLESYEFSEAAENVQFL